MTGKWEGQLTQLASADGDWSLSGADDLDDQLTALRNVVANAQQHGLTGDAGTAATASLQAANLAIEDLRKGIAEVRGSMEAANAARIYAGSRLSQLPDGDLSGEQLAAIGAATAGATIFFGPISIIAGAGAAAAAEAWLSNRREEEAQKAVQDVSSRIAAAPGNLDDYHHDPEPVPPGPVPPAPDPDRNPSDVRLPGGGGSTGGGGTSGLSGTTASPVIDHTKDPGYKGDPLAPLGTPTVTGPGVTSDGPIGSGSTTLGGGLGGAGGLGGSGALGGIGGAGLAGGLGAATALGASRLLSGGGFGALGGAGSIGAGGRVGGLGGAATADSAGNGGLLGATKGAGARGGALAAEGAEGAGARGGVAGGGMAGGGGAGGSGSRDKKAGRGLGGPIAPKLDEDADAVQRSEAAGPGGRA